MVEGVNRLKRKLDRSADGIKRAVGMEMLIGAERVTTAALALVPKDTGELASTIRHTGLEETKRGAIRVSIIAGSEATVVGAKTGARFQLAKILEFGTTTRAAQPFLLPAWRLNRKQIRGKIRGAMRAAIREVNK